nr:T9SS type A sorting domain-containing protein [Bacteroidota bacterium]
MSNTQNERLGEADSINQIVQPTEVPEYNQTIMQDIMLQAPIIGMDSVASRYQDAWAIAQQCPYSGGAAVYQARNFIAYFNDSVAYDDVASCLQQGIYRKGEVAKNYEAVEFELMPNPATNSVDVIILSKINTLKKITLRTMLGQTINQWKVEDAKRYTIYIHNYLPGIYIVEVADNAGNYEKRKLIIQK